MRCPDCCKFVGLETEEPEADNLEVSVSDGMMTVSVEVHIDRNCADCGNTLKAADFSAETETALGPGEMVCGGVDADTPDKSHDLEVEEDGIESTESGGGRYAKNMIGFELAFKVSCGREGCGFELEGTISDSMAASEFEEQV